MIESRIGPWHARAVLVLVAALALLTGVPAAADAKGPITKKPRVVGTLQVGQTLRAEGAEWRGKPKTVAWQWLRCDDVPKPGRDDDPDSLDEHCDEIGGATVTSYLAQAADRGRRLAVVLILEYEDGSAWAVSAPTAVVADALPPPPPPPPVALPPAPVVEVLPETATQAVMMRPGPLVRIRGRLTRRGARITLLMVRAPRGARITLRCRGGSCPARRWARTSRVIRVVRFQRVLRAGTKLVITVTKPGRIGKHTAIVIRRGRAPRRRDRCLYPGTTRPVRCPAA